jgi:FkbM family methyltransferase
MRVQSMLGKRLGVEPKSPASAMGWKVHYIRHRTLLYLLEEVYHQHQYYFVAGGHTPRILDCGANIGVSILYFKSLYPEARIVGFEPFEPAYQALLANIHDNGLQDVEVHQVALSPERGTVDLFYNPDHLGSLSMSTRQERIRGATQAVKAAPLSDYIDEPVDLLKIDIEGAEVPVLRELAASGKLAMIRQMIVEYHHHVRTDEDSFAEFLHLLESNGFGYRLSGQYNPRSQKERFQDLLIHAYRKQ